MEEEPTTPTAKKSKAKPTRRQSLEGKRTEDDPKSTDAPSDQLTENESGGQNTEGEHEARVKSFSIHTRTTESPNKYDANMSSTPNQPSRDGSIIAEEASPNNGSPMSKYGPVLLIGLVGIVWSLCARGSDVPLTKDTKWREKVDPHDSLTDHQRSTVFASLKPIFDKSADEDQGVSTLLILSSNESTAGKVARCLLDRVNTATQQRDVSTEIDLPTHGGGKLELDSKLKSLLARGEEVRAVLLRHIDHVHSDDGIERLRLLFAYCDGENPVIPHRLIIMTATGKNERDLRSKYQNGWPREYDFIDALMSRISGHTLYIPAEQQSLC